MFLIKDPPVSTNLGQMTAPPQASVSSPVKWGVWVEGGEVGGGLTQNRVREQGSARLGERPGSLQENWLPKEKRVKL